MQHPPFQTIAWLYLVTAKRRSLPTQVKVLQGLSLTTLAQDTVTLAALSILSGSKTSVVVSRPRGKGGCERDDPDSVLY